MKHLISGSLLFLVLLISPVRNGLEAYMVLHMLVQMPLLILSGYWIGAFVTKAFPNFLKKYNNSGVPGMVLFYIVTMYWMIPRAMDDALLFPTAEVFKYLSLCFLAGIALRTSWFKLHAIGKGFILFNYIPMFGMMAWLYLDSPVQVCNNYLESEQKELGWAFLFVLLVLMLYIIQQAFRDDRTTK